MQKYAMGVFYALHKNVQYWSELKAQYNTLSKQGEQNKMKQLLPDIEYWSQKVFDGFKAVLASESLPAYGKPTGDVSYYIAKQGDAIIFREQEEGNTPYWYQWEWDTDANELSIKDIDEFPIEFSTFAELLDEILYLLALRDCQRQLAKIAEWGRYAQADIATNEYGATHLLKLIPKVAGNRIEGGNSYINYKGLSLVYNDRKQMWEILTRGEGEIRHATFFIGDA